MTILTFFMALAALVVAAKAYNLAQSALHRHQVLSRIVADLRVAMQTSPITSEPQDDIGTSGSGLVMQPPIVSDLPETTAPALPQLPDQEPFGGGQAAEAASTEGVSRPERASLVNLEQFMGVKLFAWVGGLALFIGLVFFIKYTFDHSLVSPAVRVSVGFLAGLAALAGGLKLQQDRFAVLSRSLAATGILILYGDIFSAYAFYQLVPSGPAYALMILVTLTATLLAVRLNSQTVAVIGLLGGFLTPPLLSTGDARAFNLFSYTAILDLGLVYLAVRQCWPRIAQLSVLATLVVLILWVRAWFNPQLFNAACLAFAGFSWLFSLAVWYSSRKPALDQVSKAMAGWSLLIPLSALLFTLRVLASYYYSLIDDTAILFLFILAVDLSILLIAWARVEQRIACLYATGAIFILLAVWTSRFLTTPLLYWALAACCVFALLHGVLPHLMQKLRPALNPPWWVHLAVPAAFCLIAVPLLNFHESSPLIWLGIGVLSILGISLAMLTFSVVALVSTVLLTALITVSWLLSVPASLLGISEGLLVIGSFALIFFFAGLRMVRKVSAEDAPVSVSIYDSADMVSSPEFRTQIPAVLPAILPFLLLITLLMRLKPDNPTSVFALAGLMSLLLLGLVRWSRIDWAGVMGLTGVFFLQLAWHALPVSRHSPLISLAWIGAFYLLFSIFPFMFSASIGTRLVPWFTAVLAGLLHFILAYILIKDSFPNQFMGLLPALFGVFSMLALWKVLGILRELEAERQNSILALFGGLVIFFITLIFPIQFSRQWLTISWAMEGAALIWLFRRIPHSGLSRAGVCLLLLSFVRLAFNPAVFSYSERSPVPVFNWYLYTYGIVAICQFIGMYLHAGSAEAVRSKYTASVLGGIGTILLFLLLNLEIADYFSGGSSAMFKFSASFAQDMTYSLGWAAFAFILLSVGMWAGQRGARLAAIGLLSVTLLKLFMHDLWRLGGLYRIAAFVGLALVLIPVSFLYQRFMPTGVKPRAMKDEK